MKVYISYALSKAEEYLISILAFHLQKDGFIIAGISTPSSDDLTRNTLAYAAQTAIASADLLIGLVSAKSTVPDSLYREWNYVKEQNIPFLLLIEKGTSIREEFKTNTIFFDRNNMNEAIKSIEEKKKFYKLSNYGRVKNFVWDAGGDILLAILPILADSNSKSVA